MQNLEAVLNDCSNDKLKQPENAFLDFFLFVQKHPSKSVIKKRCSENMQQICSRTLIGKCDFNKVLQLNNFIEITLRHGCSLVNSLHIFRTPFSKITSGGMLLLVPILFNFFWIH